MAVRTAAQFKSLYGTSGSLFPDNTTGEISEADVRAFGEDIADSFSNEPDDAYTGAFPQVTATGTDTYAATLAPAITAYATGQKFQIKFTNASSGVSTLNLNALGAKKIFVNPTTQATIAHIVAGQISLLVYDAALDAATGGFLMIGAPSVGGGTVTSVTGTTNRITSTGGATPVINIDAAYDAAITAQIAAAQVGLWDDRGTFDASVAAYPSSGGSGTAGAILKGDIWTISVAGTLPTGQVVEIGDTVRALIDTPGNTQANWAILQNNIGFVPAPIDSPTFTGTPGAPTPSVGDNDTSIATTAFVQAEIAAKTVGIQDFFIPAAAFWPRVTAGCSSLTQTEIATSLINIQTLDFNQTTQQYAQVHYKFPKKYNLSTLTFEIEWTATTGTGSVVWGVAAVSLADGDVLTTAFGSQVNVTDAAGTANTERNSATSAVVTIGNTPAVADGIYLQITRVTGDGADDMAADAKFKGISIHITTSAATDA